jgi:hypothetical protein
MTQDLFTSPLFIAAAIFGVLGATLLLLALVAFFRLRLLSFGLRTLLGLLLLSLGGLAGALAVGVHGYRAFTYEAVAARITVTPTGKQRFDATIRYPEGREVTYAIAGDEIYVDAHILKWSPYANWLGLHTAYELDRIAGRYHGVKDEQTADRTVHALSRDRVVDLYSLRRRHAFLAPLLDAQYGSATFVPVTKPAELELRVSTSGLLLREAAAPAKP